MKENPWYLGRQKECDPECKGCRGLCKDYRYQGLFQVEAIKMAVPFERSSGYILSTGDRKGVAYVFPEGDKIVLMGTNCVYWMKDFRVLISGCCGEEVNE